MVKWFKKFWEDLAWCELCNSLFPYRMSKSTAMNYPKRFCSLHCEDVAMDNEAHGTYIGEK